MAWNKTTWIDLIGTNASKQSIASGATAGADIDCNATNKLIYVTVKVVVVFGASPDDDVSVELLGKDLDGANEADTLAMFAASIPQVTSSEERATYQFNVASLDGLRVEVNNNDSADAVTAWVSWMGGYQ